MRDNPELQAALGGFQPGDRLTLEFDVMVKANDGDTFEASIEGITCECEDDEQSEDESMDDMGDKSMDDMGDMSDDKKSSKSKGPDAEPGKTVEPSAEEPIMVVMLSKSAKKKKSNPEANAE